MSKKDGIAALPSVARNDTVWVGAFEPATRAMGPGLRACLWVRGCPMRCAGCATPEFLAFPEGHSYMTVIARPEPTVSLRSSAERRGKQSHPTQRVRLPRRFAPRNDQMRVADISAWIDHAVAEHGITGVSFSGGEPFAQALALAHIAEHARTRGLSALSWSGFTRQHLEGPRAPAGSHELLGQLDVLIDGPFVQRRANGDPLRGSENQRIHLLTDRHQSEEFTQADVEVRLGQDGSMVTTGVMDYAATEAALALLGVR